MHGAAMKRRAFMMLLGDAAARPPAMPAFACLMTRVAAGFPPGAAASPGCDALNPKPFAGMAVAPTAATARFEKTISGFAVGDVITMNFSCFSSSSRLCDFKRAELKTGDGLTILEYPGKHEPSYRISGERRDTTLSLTLEAEGFSAISAKASC